MTVIARSEATKQLVYLGEANPVPLILTWPLTLIENEGFSPELVYLGEANLSMKGRVYAPFRLKKI
jgi:hypothetical protein